MSDSTPSKRTSWNGAAIAQGRMVELAREPGRSVGLTLHDNGDLTIDCCDGGPLVEGMMGDGDYERFCTVEAKDVPRLAAVLLHAEFEGDAQAVDHFKALCDAYGIKARITSW
ncbi:hypothetical protein HFP57_12860 [Parasphingopyxis algicola]|uniref:hypothetical protein n=1 Tax=Parasphingopyxis algicola TaxID=2026624 RepID=UPI0015A428BF|nr:hypothetical protein [Parasphingopyxis algicola]QLC25822.1 hypothetical protein HFP57_12860 [Parasphingopyxis algicola]